MFYQKEFLTFYIIEQKISYLFLVDINLTILKKILNIKILIVTNLILIQKNGRFQDL